MRNVLLLCTLLMIVSQPLWASSVQQSSVLKAVVTSVKAVDPAKGHWNLTVTLQENPEPPPAQAGKFQKGSIVPVTVKGQRGRSFKKGDAVSVRWQWYSGMTPTGPMSALSWQLAP